MDVKLKLAGIGLGISLTISGAMNVPNQAHATKCPMIGGESCPPDYGINPCNTLAYDMAVSRENITNAEWDRRMAEAECHQAKSGDWYPNTQASPVVVSYGICELPNTGSGSK